ncbi:MAG: N-acetylmuramic acid 6-phosphate etherase [Bacilli bacterium]|nr:N-acetylmuramic acid 6-phosphate etherase [Bacilli bacterium]
MIKEDIKSLSTEARNKNSYNIDTKSTREILSIINEEDKKVAYLIEDKLCDIAKVVDAVVEAFNNGGRLIYVGAGTSGRMGLIDAVECRPTYSVPDDMVMGIMAGGKEAFVRAKEGAEDSIDDAINDLKNIELSNKDIVVGIAASGRTPYVIGAIEYANKIGANTVAIATVKNSKIGMISKLKIEVDTGAEVVSGSTRMKAGTAQKLICNMISTASMIRIGKVYNNLMVDVAATNQKLIKRAVGIIQEITDASEELCLDKMNKYKSVKKAVISILLDIDDEDKIENLLKKNNNNLRNVIGDK